MGDLLRQELVTSLADIKNLGAGLAQIDHELESLCKDGSKAAGKKPSRIVFLRKEQCTTVGNGGSRITLPQNK